MISGHDIFRIVDEAGMPLSILRDMMRERGMAFDVREFVEAAFKSGNYKKPERLENMLLEDVTDERCRELVLFTISQIYFDRYKDRRTDTAIERVYDDGRVSMTYVNPEPIGS